MFIVTGASGQLGRAVVQNLLKRVPADQIGVSVRDPGRVADLKGLGVRVRQGDFDDPQSLSDAFEGAAQVLIISSNARASGGDPLAQHRSAIDAARRAGAQRIFYTSHMGASATSAFPPMRDHAATEEMLRVSGVAWTALRHGFYAKNGAMLLGDASSTGVVEAPADGPVSWTAHADLAEADAIILSQQAPRDGPTAPLTGSQALDLEELAAIASEVHGRSIQRTIVPDADWRSSMVARGMPERAVDTLLGLYRASRAGEFKQSGSMLEQLLSRPPTTMRDIISG